MKIIINKLKSLCAYCGKAIVPKEHINKVKYKRNTFHLICFYKWLKIKVEDMECSLKELKNFRKQMGKYETQLMLETLENN